MVKLNQILERMGDQVQLHALFLNTLSLLEYIGARKIIKSQLDQTVCEELLVHIAEEVRHAHLLKRLALKLSNGVLSSYSDEHLLCGHEGRAYIQSVDHGAANALCESDKWKNYLLTTLLIEERAAKVYPIYNLYLSKIGLKDKIGSIIRDEDKHLKAVMNDLTRISGDLSRKIDSLYEMETLAFDLFMDSILLRLR